MLIVIQRCQVYFSGGEMLSAAKSQRPESGWSGMPFMPDITIGITIGTGCGIS
ncbi:MAG: hypothetical protein ABL903_06460 [Methylococcales bacterium]